MCSCWNADPCQLLYLGTALQAAASTCRLPSLLRLCLLQTGVPQQNGAAMDSDSYTSSIDSRSSAEDEEVERTQQAVELVAEMQLTAEQLKVSCVQSDPKAAGRPQAVACSNARALHSIV